MRDDRSAGVGQTKRVETSLESVVDPRSPFVFCGFDQTPFEDIDSLSPLPPAQSGEATQQGEATHCGEASDLPVSDTQILAPGVLELRTKLISMGVCDDRQWKVACERAATTDNANKILNALYLLQNSKEHKQIHPPMTNYQLRQMQAGQIDELLVGHYLILEELLTDRTGTQYKVWNRNLARIEALKLLSASVSDELDSETQHARLQQILRKIEGLAQLNHHQITKIYHAGEHNGTPYIVTEFVEGIDLQTWIEQTFKMGDQVPVFWAAARVREIADALRTAQAQDLAHQELTPRNILVTASGDLKIQNFGLANLLHPSQRSNDDLDDEQRAVLAPEHWLYPDAISPEADVYALGCLLFFMLSGRPVFEGMSPTELMTAHLHEEPPRITEIRPDVPRSLNTLLSRMLAKVPEDRIGCDQLIDELLPYCQVRLRNELLEQPMLHSATLWLVSFTTCGLILFMCYQLVLAPQSSSRRLSEKPVVLNREVSDALSKSELEAKLQKYQREHSDVWASDQPLTEFVQLHWSADQGESALDSLLVNETARRRWLLWLADHQRNNQQVWATPDALAAIASIFDVQFQSLDDLNTKKDEVRRLTAEAYQKLWREWVTKQQPAVSALWASVEDLERELNIGAAGVSDESSLTAAKRKLVELVQEKQMPALPDDGEQSPELVSAARAYRWAISLPAESRMNSLVEGRTVLEGKPRTTVPIDSSVTFEVRTARRGYLTAFLFEAGGKQLIIQTGLLEPNQWHPLFVMLASKPGSDEIALYLSDSPPDLPSTLSGQPVYRIGAGLLKTQELGMDEVREMQELFSSPPAYDRAVQAVRSGQSLPMLTPSTQVNWYSFTSLQLTWK